MAEISMCGVSMAEATICHPLKPLKPLNRRIC